MFDLQYVQCNIFLKHTLLIEEAGVNTLIFKLFRVQQIHPVMKNDEVFSYSNNSDFKCDT